MDPSSNIAFKSKRAMATAALFTDIFKKYLDRNKCEYITNEEEQEQFASEILDHVIIVGGFCRDILLNRPINDIDIIINLRELCKLQTNHLKKYHSKKENQGLECRCVYWQLYLQRFSDDPSNINEQQKTNREMIMMHNLNYIFNARFWLGILKQDDLLDNKLSTKDSPEHGFYSCQIVNSVKYGDINLDQQSIDLIDTFDIDQCYSDSFVSDYARFKTFHRKSRQLSMSGIDIGQNDSNDPADDEDADGAWYTTPGNGLGGDEQKANKSRPETDASMNNHDNHNHDHDHSHDQDNKETSSRRHGRLKSMAVLEFGIDDLGGDFGNFGFQKTDETPDGKAQTLSRPEYITIEVPIYSGKVRYKLLNYDFSINTAILPLSNIIKLKQHNNNFDASGDFNDGPMTWVETIENGLGECDAIQDATVNRILKCPEWDHDMCTIKAHPITFIFWRIVRWMIRAPNFKVDKKLIMAQAKDFDKWLNKTWFEEPSQCQRFLKYMAYTIESECNTVQDVRQMLSIMNLLQFNAPFVQIVQDVQSVRHALMDAIASVKNDNVPKGVITDTFKEYQYPIEEQLFKMPSATEEELKKYKEKKNFLEEQVVTKNQRIEDLEKQNDRLLKEVQYLQQLNQKDDRVTELEEQNGRLLKELQVVNDSKIKLAVNASQTIDQLRKYLSEYQQLIVTLSNQ